MKKLNLILILMATVAFNASSIAGDRYNNHSYSNKHNSQHGNYKKHKKYYNNYGYNNNSYSNHGNNRPYRNNYQRQSRNNNRNYRRYSRNQRHDSYRKHNNYYNNYQPYYQSQYTYRPLRGLGHYFYRDNYGYGHWHDNNWCVENHSQAYYNNYYSDYPYQNGWAYGDGDYGINSYLNF